MIEIVIWDRILKITLFKKGYLCQEKNGCQYFKWVDVEDGSEWQRLALIEARDQIEEQRRLIEQLHETISELAHNLERIQQEEEIVRDFQNLYV